MVGAGKEGGAKSGPKKARRGNMLAAMIVKLSSSVHQSSRSAKESGDVELA